MRNSNLIRSFFLALCLCAHLVFSQAYKIDSLKQELSKAVSDTDKIKTRNALCRIYAYSKPDTALVLVKESFRIARTDEASGIIASTCMYAGISFNNLGSRDSAEFYFTRAIQMAHRHKKSFVEAASYMGLGTCYNFWKKQDKALQHYMTSYNLFKDLGDSGKMASVALGLGNVYSDLNNINKALEYFNTSLQFAEARKDSGFMAKCYNNIGNLYQKNGTYDKALAYYTRSVDIKKALGDEHGIANTYLNFGNIYTQTHKLDLARFFYGKAKESYARIGDSAEYMNTINYIAECLLIEKKIPEALANLKEAEGICLRNHYTADLAGVFGALTRVYIMLGDTSNARINFEKFSATKDSIITEDMSRQIAEMTAHFENDKQKHELILKELELKAEKRVSTAYIIATLVFSILLVILVFFLFKLKKVNSELRKADKETKSNT